MLSPYGQEVSPPENLKSEVLLDLLLFIDDSFSSQEQIRKIESYLQSVKIECPFQLQVIEIAKEPHLVEHFRLIVTPALVKNSPAPRQIIAGSDLALQLEKWWPKWHNALKQIQLPLTNSSQNQDSIDYSRQLMQLTDEVFRLKQEKEKLLEQIRFKDQVLAMLVHDLRSPLTAASIAVETLELANEQPDSERNQKLKETVFRQAKKQFQIMNRMITDILEASKNSDSKLSLQPKPIFLQDLCLDIIQQLSSNFPAKSQTIKQDLPQDLPKVYADEELIRQVIINLLENAIKYTPEGGEITLSILHRTSQKVQVSVCDTGFGIPLEKQERIFEGHFRLPRDTSEQGYGLGLSLCRKVIQSHYGQIWVDSSNGNGSCFHFTLPIYR